MQEKETAQIASVSDTTQVFHDNRVDEDHLSFHELSEGQHTQPRILVVEDDPTLAALEAGFLSAYGYTVMTVNSGEHALSVLRQSIPDLVVLDLELTGGVHGWEVLQALRSSTSIPVLLTTSSATAVREHMRRHGESRSTLDHLPKPYPVQVLLKRIQRLLMITPN